MKKYPKQIRCDERGQLVIPRDIRNDQSIEEGTGFLMYVVANEGIILKKVDTQPLGAHHEILNEIEQKATKLGLKTLGGLDMLIWQALATWEIWWGPIKNKQKSLQKMNFEI